MCPDHQGPVVSDGGPVTPYYSTLSHTHAPKANSSLCLRTGSSQRGAFIPSKCRPMAGVCHLPEPREGPSHTPTLSVSARQEHACCPAQSGLQGSTGVGTRHTGQSARSKELACQEFDFSK